jgi:hypothetical protein
MNKARNRQTPVSDEQRQWFPPVAKPPLNGKNRIVVKQVREKAGLREHELAAEKNSTVKPFEAAGHQTALKLDARDNPVKFVRGQLVELNDVRRIPLDKRKEVPEDI